MNILDEMMEEIYEDNIIDIDYIKDVCDNDTLYIDFNYYRNIDQVIYECYNSGCEEDLIEDIKNNKYLNKLISTLRKNGISSELIINNEHGLEIELKLTKIVDL